MSELKHSPAIPNFTDTDVNPTAAAAYLDVVARVIAPLKARSFDLLGLAPGHSVLEVGCGLGDDAFSLEARVGASGRVVGVVSSRDMIHRAQLQAAARKSTVTFQVADALSLPFPAHSFDACREDRMLQHLADPGAAVREMVRVTRPGGKICLLEPDWATLVGSGGDETITVAIQRAKVDSIRSGRVGRDLPKFLSDAGGQRIVHEPAAVGFTDLEQADFVYGFGELLRGLVQTGAVAEVAAAEWWREANARNGSGSFHAYVTAVIATAEAP